MLTVSYISGEFARSWRGVRGTGLLDHRPCTGSQKPTTGVRNQPITNLIYLYSATLRPYRGSYSTYQIPKN